MIKATFDYTDKEIDAQFTPEQLAAMRPRPLTAAEMLQVDIWFLWLVFGEDPE